MRLSPLLSFALPVVVALAGCNNGKTPDTESCSGGVAPRTWYSDTDGDGYGDPTYPTRACDAPEGAVADHSDCDDTMPEVFPNHPEVCDGVDNNCDGTPDNSPTDGGTWYLDADQDSYGDPNVPLRACDQPAGSVTNTEDCDDARADAFPGNPEVCDGADNDCNGVTDDGVPDAPYWHADGDGDGYGDPENMVQACFLPDNGSLDATDCDDANAASHPDADEICDGNDNDCNELVDDNAVDESTFYRDGDGDGYGSPGSPTLGCTAPPGTADNFTDCDDTRSAINPGAEEVCDTIDNDCDGTVDTDAPNAPDWFIDTDGDGYGDDSTLVASCAMPLGYTGAGGDCDDADPAVSPGAAEVCNSLDDDCNGAVDDDASDAIAWYTDADRDGVGAAGTPTYSCEAPAHTSATAGDCDDDDPRQYPGNEEDCDGIDNDCNGSTDDGFTVYYLDTDGDGYGAGDGNCDPTDRVSTNTDCDDTRASVYPGATELCDERANDCSRTSSWNQTSEDGKAAFEADSGVTTDLTSTLIAGSTTSPVDVELAEAGTLRLCRGTWHAFVEVAAVSGTVTVRGPSGSSRTTLSSNGTNDNSMIISNGGADLVVDGLTISDGYSDQGGAIHMEYGTLSVVDSTISSCSASQYGGGIYARVGDVSLDNVTMSSNDASATGGAIDMAGGTLLIDGGSFSSNLAETYGGAIHWVPLTAGDGLSVDGTSFTTNTVAAGSSAGGGGAISASARVDATIDVANATFTSNGATGDVAMGGAFYGEVYNGSAVIATFDTVTMTSNTVSSSGHSGAASYAGGGGLAWNVYDASGAGASALSLIDVTLSRDTSTASTSSDGGGLNLVIADGGGSLLLSNVDIDTCTSTSSDFASGGAAFIYLDTAETAVIDGGTWSSNRATGTTQADGGALALISDGAVSILDTTFSSNSLAATGSSSNIGDGLAFAAFMTDSDLSLDTVTVSSNTGSSPSASYVGLYGTSNLSVVGSTRVSSNDGSGMNVASTGAGAMDVDGAVFTQNDTHGLYIEPSGTSFALTLIGSTTASEGSYQNGSAGIYMPFTSTGTYTIDATSWDLGTEGSSSDNASADVYFASGNWSWSDNQTFRCAGTSCS